MGRTSATILGAVLGAIATYLAVVAGLLAAFLHTDRDGGVAMGIVFAIGPFSAVIGGTVFALIARRWLGTGDQAGRTDPPAARPLYQTAFMWLLGALATLCLAVAVVQLLSAGGLSDGLTALAVAAALAVATRWLARRNPAA
ncbi:MAG: hypothetical protein ACOYLQ_16045 [Hyphomicrobiaceae bacterium]